MTTQSVILSFTPGEETFQYQSKSRPQLINPNDFIICLYGNRNFQGTLCGIAQYQTTHLVLRLKPSHRQCYVHIAFPHAAVNHSYFAMISSTIPWVSRCLMSDIEWINHQFPTVNPLDIFQGPVTIVQHISAPPSAKPPINHIIPQKPEVAHFRTTSRATIEVVRDDQESEVLGRWEYRQ